MTSAKKIKNQQEQNPVDPNTPDELQRTDALDDFLFHATNYIYKKRKLFITFGIVLVVALLGGYGVDRYITYHNNLRNEGLFDIESVINDQKLINQDKYNQALPLINDFMTQHTGTKQAEIALFYRSSLHFQQKKYEEAEKDLRAVIGLLENPSEFHVLASIYLSNILRDQSKNEEAVEILLAAKSEIMTDIVMMELAEAYIGIDKKDEAKTLLQAIEKDYPNSLYQSRVKQLLATL